MKGQNSPTAGRPRSRPSGAGHPGRAYPTPVPATALLDGALPRVDWSDAYAVPVPIDGPRHDPQEWADAIFSAPPPWVRALFGVRQVLVRLVGIEPGGRDVFATVDWRPDEVLVGVDQQHLGFRASVLVEPGRVVLSTVVQLRNRRGRAYSGLVRRIHPWVVRGMVTRAARRLAVPA